MGSNLRRKVSEYIKTYIYRSRWHKAVTVLAGIVVFCTAYALILPAITMTRETTCGLEEHEHTEACYTVVPAQAEMLCSAESLGIHQHTADCKNADGQLVCGYADFVVHTHDDLCYSEDGTLICTLDEIAEHEHDEDCYKTEKTLICGQEESGHEHTEACYTRVKGDLTCELPETEGHTHSEECYETAENGDGSVTATSANATEKVLVCGKDEEEPHTHTDDCYEWTEELTCGKEEAEGHIHTDECYEEKEVLDCDEKEVVLHTHDESCYDENGALTCGQVEVKEHQHTAECVRIPDGEVKKLTCGQQEHKHTEECYAAEENYICGLEEHEHTEECYAADGTLICGLEEHKHTEECLAPEFMLMAALTGTVVDSGTLEGTSLSWAVTEDEAGNQTLTISGNGAIPDYVYAAQAPWNKYTTSSKMKKLVIEAGVTRIGNHSFMGNYFTECELPDTLESLGMQAFYKGTKLTEITIPGSVKTIESECFYGNSSLEKVDLGEGVVSIGNHAFFWLPPNSALPEFHIPASLESIGDECFTTVERFTVDEGNTFFSVDEDGVLYDYNKKTLLIYPKNRKAAEYVVPKSVEEIAPYALRRVQHTDKLVIDHPVKFRSGNAYFAYSNYKEIELADGVDLTRSGIYFRECYQLGKLKLPANMSYIDNPIESCTSLEEFTIPSGVTAINSLKLPASVQKLTYNAKDVTTWGAGLDFGNSAYVELVIGGDVENIDWTKAGAVMANNLKYAHTIRFTGENAFTVVDGSFAQAPSPISRISGSVYVDENGVVYTYDKDAGTAKLVYCPPGITELTIPETISPEEGVTCTVNTVGQDAMKLAENLKSVTIEKPENITKLEPYAFANCPLESVNGQNSCEAVYKLFTALTTEDAKGLNVFYNTKLTGAPGSGAFETDMSGKKSLNVERDDATGLQISVSSDGDINDKWQVKKPEEGEEEDEDTGGYRMLTGQTVTILASTGRTNTEKEFVYRVYIQKTDDTAQLGFKPGETQEYKGVEVTYHATEDPNTYYAEFSIPVGETATIPITVNYPSPSTAGGGITVWGMILTEKEASENEEKLIESTSGTIQTYWTTEEEIFEVEKTATKPNDLKITGDGKGGAKPSSDLYWEIKLTHQNGTNPTYGKDYATSVDYTDVIEFPDGVSWNADVIEAIKAENVWKTSDNDFYVRIGETEVKVAAINPSNTTRMSKAQLVWDEALGKPVIKWTSRNSDMTKEMGEDTVNLTVCADAVSVDMSKIDENEKYTIKNNVDAQVHFHYGKDQDLESSAEKTISGGNGTISLRKTGTPVTYFGEDITYTLDLENTGAREWTAQEKGVYVLRDTLQNVLYLSPENMEKMFGEKYGEFLTVTVDRAILAEWTSVQGTDGETQTWRHPGNSNLEGEEKHSLSITKVGENYQVAVEGGQTFVDTSLFDALKAAGYGVTKDTGFTCEWKLGQEDQKLTIQGGENRQFMIHATVKDSFKLLPEDWPHQYLASESLNVENDAHLLRPDQSNEVSSGSVRTSVKREARIDKAVSKNGTLLGDEPVANDGDVLDYQLKFTHHGNGEYEALPMVDDLYGSQYLMVPADQNTGLAKLVDQGLKEYEKDGIKYYLLNEKVNGGVYENVAVGVDKNGHYLKAASITVKKANTDTSVDVGENQYEYSGLHTQIKWYFPHLDGGDYSITVDYKALVDTALSGVEYTIGNIVWMNDRTNDRIYASLWGGGSIIDFKKEIVTKKGGSPEEDEIDQDDLSTVGKGDTVTYRLTLRNIGQEEYAINGLNLADALPATYGTFRWEKGTNVEILGVVTKGNPSSPEFENYDEWDIGESYGNLPGERQYMLWPDTSSIKFHGSGTVYIYVVLTFPEDDTTWGRYTAENHGIMVDNTLYVYRFPDNVLHELEEGGEVLLQKGVYGFARRNTEQAKGYLETGKDRRYYNNRDSKYRSVTYYVALYNGSNKRLYLNDLYDKLPKGFTYQQMVKDARSSTMEGGESQITTIGHNGNLGANPLVEISDSSVIYRSAQIKASAKGQSISFSISGKGNDYPVEYDEKRKQYYLNKGDAIVFGYVADIGESADTEDIATNTIGMLYTDHLNTGLNLIDKETLGIHAPMKDTRYTTQNDGERYTHDYTSSEEVEKEYGLKGEEGTWLESRVDLSRGGIAPGITKTTEYYKDHVGGKITKYENSVYPQYTVYWKTKIQNDGTVSMTDYTFTDIMPSPYLFEGMVSCMIYDAENRTMLTGGTILTDEERKGERALLNFPERKMNLETIAVDNKYTSGVINAESDGSWNKLIVDKKMELEFSLARNASGAEIFKLHFKDPKFSIPEGGSMVITFSGRNPSSQYVDRVYTNNAYLTPTQTFGETSGQGNVEELDGKRSVHSASPVTVAFGYATSSVKSVVEKGNEANEAFSTNLQHNTILLQSTKSEFRYTLTVSNDTDKPMERLVVIDNLPEVGDHSPFDVDSKRGSEFDVEFADHPNIVAEVYDQNDKLLRTLTRGPELEIEYALTTTFGGPQSPDWHVEGEDEEHPAAVKWFGIGREGEEDPGEGIIPETKLNKVGARALRFNIFDGRREEIIPPKSKVKISFTARVKGDAEPGKIAWNSFGYHYHLTGVQEHLESMPSVVGVKIPSVPRLTKQLVDGKGNPAAPEEPETFSFFVYKGEALKGSYETEEALINALKERGIAYQEYELTVPKYDPEIPTSSNASETITLEDDDKWKWEKGAQYTIVEIPREGYRINGFNSSSENKSYTFTYDPATSVTITCQNQDLRWSIDLTKKDGEGKQNALKGAVFGLYGPKAVPEFTIPDEYKELKIEQRVETPGKVWYLVGIGTSDSEGKIGWNDLLEDQYYLLELKAPDGYKPIDGWIVSRTDAGQGVYERDVLNYTGTELPQTGGTGTLSLTAGGLALLVLAGLMYEYKRLRKEDKEEKNS